MRLLPCEKALVWVVLVCNAQVGFRLIFFPKILSDLGKVG